VGEGGRGEGGESKKRKDKGGILTVQKKLFSCAIGEAGGCLRGSTRERGKKGGGRRKE
jgi:hypothetical protein